MIIVFKSYFSCSAWSPSQDQALLLVRITARSKVLSLESFQAEFQSKKDCLMHETRTFTILYWLRVSSALPGAYSLFQPPIPLPRVESWVER